MKPDDLALIKGDWVPCSSSWIEAFRYDASTQTLWVRTGGKDYSIPNLGANDAVDFARAPSKGKWLHQNTAWGQGRQP